MKKIILYLLIVILLLTIFFFSAQSGAKSIKVSDNFTGNIIDKVSNNKVSSKTKNKLIYKSRFVIRKIAHFTLYFTLGILIYLLLTIYKVNKRFIISLGVCFILACFDEFHQLFVIGRTARFYDCMIDTLGSLISISILKIIELSKKKSSN